MAVQVLDIKQAAAVARRQSTSFTSEYDEAINGPEAVELLDQLRDRKLAVEPDQARFATECDRWDNLYYPQGFTVGGASHWVGHESAHRPGRAHVSVNVYPTYVDVPAALQSVTPIENMVATGVTPQDRAVAAMAERLYVSWKDTEQVELKFHRACLVKGLYGRTAGKIYWDDELGRPCLEIVDQPRNLYLGWRDTDYQKLEWALYCYEITPSTALEDWGLQVDSYDENGKTYPYVLHPTAQTWPGQGVWRSTISADLRVEVYDYWYRKPADNAKIRFGKPTKFETWNAIFVGNVLVKNQRHREYKGKMPYVPLFNTYIPGVPQGRPELYDIEQLVREKDERLSENAQMIGRIVNGQMWQLTGPEAPNSVPSNLRPVPNNVIAPGPGNRLESIEPWAPEFQLDQYLNRIDREMTDVSGLNDLLRGMAPTQVLSSGKAISALVANYETRISMKRELLYRWRREVWDLVAEVWSGKNSALKPVLDGKALLDIQPPSLTPRDDAETATVAGNLKELKLWSAQRAMDKVGVDDPETEMDIIRSEQTDATLNPASVQVMVTLMATLQQLGMQMQQLQQMAGQASPGAEAGTPGPEAGLAAMRGTAPDVTGQEQLNAEGEQPMAPGEQMPANTPEGAAAAGELPPEGALQSQPGPAGPSQLLSQFQVQEGEAKGRIIGQSTIQKNA